MDPSSALLTDRVAVVTRAGSGGRRAPWPLRQERPPGPRRTGRPGRPLPGRRSPRFPGWSARPPGSKSTTRTAAPSRASARAVAPPMPPRWRWRTSH